MRAYELGDDTPEVLVTGSIHGNKPCGARAIERFAAEDPNVERPMKLIVANEEVPAVDERYLDDDPNRAFPGDPNAENHERRLTHDLGREVRGTTAFSIHFTQLYAEPFATADTVDVISRSILLRLPIDVAIGTNHFAGGHLIEHARTVEVGTGLQKSDKVADNVYWLARAFLTMTNVLPASVVVSDGECEGGASDDTASQTEDDRLKLNIPEKNSLDVFRLFERLPKPPANQYEAHVTNFESAVAGKTFARADAEQFVADCNLYPIFLSAYGYADIFGYAGEEVGTLP